MDSEELILKILCHELVGLRYMAGVTNEGGHGPWILVDEGPMSPDGKRLRNRFAISCESSYVEGEYAGNVLAISRWTFTEDEKVAKEMGGSNFWEPKGKWDINDPVGIISLLDVLKEFEMKTAERFTDKKALAFQLPNDTENNTIGVRLIQCVELVEVEGVWDNERRRWVDPPTVTSGWGNVRPDAVAEKTGIPIPN